MPTAPVPLVARLQAAGANQYRIFRFDPALDNNGWHDSTDFPVDIDNPLNGNMYKPLYFDGGLAIHGANNVPTSPQSKGCARLKPADQDRLLAWLGLDTLTGSTYSKDRIGVTVTVRGRSESLSCRLARSSSMRCRSSGCAKYLAADR